MIPIRGESEAAGCATEVGALGADSAACILGDRAQDHGELGRLR